MFWSIFPKTKRPWGRCSGSLKKGGKALIQVLLSSERESTEEDLSITSPEERKRHFGQKDHVRIYGMDIEQRLISAGFQVDARKYAQELGEESIKKHALLSDGVIFYCKKA